MKSLCQNVVITGASSGIGAEMAKLYAAPEISLALLGRDRERLEKIAGICRAEGADTITASIDITRQQDLQQWLLNHDMQNPIDIFIINAGISHIIDYPEPIEEMGNIRSIMDTNFFGAVAAANPVLGRMRARKTGQLVIVCSLSAYRGVPLMPAYSASKAAVKSYFESIRGLLKKDGITISIACPGFVSTPMTDKLDKQRFMMMSAEAAARRIKHGADKRQTMISFPGIHVFGLWLLNLLPNALADRILLTALGMNK